MFRFVALAWNIEHSARSELAQTIAQRLLRASGDWREVASAPGLRVFCAGITRSSEPYVLPDQRGVVLGTLFERNRDLFDENVPRKTVLDESAAERIVASKGREIIDRFWGRYVAFVRDGSSARLWVLRDPTGTLPCLHTQHRGVSVFFSCLSDVTDLALKAFGVDWSQVRWRVLAGMTHGWGSALEGVSALHNGECLEVDGERMSRQFYWNPLEVARSGLVEDVTQAIHAMRAVGKSSIQAWASVHDNIIVRTSGGLDSSIVLGCLRDAPSRPRISCLTYYMADDPDLTLPWARAAASAAGAEMIEHPRNEQFDFTVLRSFAPTPEPVRDFAFMTGFSQTERNVARQTGATAVCTGDGGDPLFGSFSSKFAARDFLRRRGFHPRLFKVARDVAMLRDHTIWVVLKDAWRARFGGAVPNEYERMIRRRPLVSEGLLALLNQEPYWPHPWYRSPDAPRSWATIRQMGSMSQLPPFYDPAFSAKDPGPEYVTPLYSQPLVELCLRIPPDVLIDGGRDRSVARQAFAAEVPRMILDHHSKDYSPGFLERTVGRHLALFRERLLDGALVREGLIDRRKLEANLAGMATNSPLYVGELLDCLFIEEWVRYWTTARHEAAA